MDGHGEQYDRAASEAPKQVFQQLTLVAPTLKEIERLLEQPGRAKAAMARYEQITRGARDGDCTQRHRWRDERTATAAVSLAVNMQ